MKIVKLFLVFGVINSQIEGEQAFENEDFADFVKNVFSKAFSYWPFNMLDGVDHMEPREVKQPLEAGSAKNSPSALKENVENHEITWYPIDMQRICLAKAYDEDICGKKSISIKRICSQMQRGAQIKAYCSSTNKSDDTASFRISIRYERAVDITAKNTTTSANNASIPIKHAPVQTRSEPKHEKMEKIVDAKFVGPYATQHGHYIGRIKPEIPYAPFKSDKATVVDPKSSIKRDAKFDAKMDQNSLKTGYSMSMYGIAMSSGALGTVMIVLIIVITYSVIRVVRIRNSQQRIERAKSERKKVLRLQKLSSLISEDSEIEENIDN